MKIKVGDKVKIYSLSLSHLLVSDGKNLDAANYYTVEKVDLPLIVISGGLWYDETDVSELYTKEDNPEYFL